MTNLGAFSLAVMRALTPSERNARCEELAKLLADRLEAARNFEDEVFAIVQDLRGLGYELYSLDEDVGHQAWGRSYVRPTSPSLLLDIYAPSSVFIKWTE